MAYLRKKYLMTSTSDSESDTDIDYINELVRETKTTKISSPNTLASTKLTKTSLKPDEELLDKYNKLLKKYWGYDGLKPTQFDVIKKVIEENKDVCAVLATGFGKSICYQLPYLITGKNVIVISPLIALMHEQGQEMSNKGINTAVFNSETTSKKKEEEKQVILSGTNKLIFMTPEFFIKSYDFIQEIKERLCMVCIDEAHAVSTWGLDFRPGYVELKIIRDWVPQIPILTLTATASTKVRDDIYKILKLDNPELVMGNFDRPNIQIRVLPRGSNVIGDIESLINKYPGDYSIIYCKTRDDTELVANKIKERGIEAHAYHAGMNDKNKKKVQQDFIDGKVKCMCATIAFGMGINIPNVRVVIHYNCPKNIESYYQEIGRAGRDGKASECVLFYSAKDFTISRFLIKDITNVAQKSYQEEQIRQIERFVYSTECRRKVILTNFGQTMESCVNCDNCLKALNGKVPTKLCDYTCPIYLLFGVVAKTNGRFGFKMCIHVLLGRRIKIKDWMEEWEEYGQGNQFGNEDWWRELIRFLTNAEYFIETQTPGTFFTTIDFTKKGRELRAKMIEGYDKFENLVSDIGSKKYANNYKISCPEIKVVKPPKLSSSEPKVRKPRTKKTSSLTHLELSNK
jgi:ATP-dependent DNA helicase RecQ